MDGWKRGQRNASETYLCVCQSVRPSVHVCLGNADIILGQSNEELFFGVQVDFGGGTLWRFLFFEEIRGNAAAGGT